MTKTGLNIQSQEIHRCVFYKKMELKKMPRYRPNTLTLLLIIMLGCILFLGCIDSTAPTDDNKPDSIRLSNITSAFKELPEVLQFLTVYPNASINISYFEGDELDNSFKDSDMVLEAGTSPKALYRVSVYEENSSIISWFDEKNNHVKMNVHNPQMLEDTSERLISDENLTFNISKVESTIYVTFTGGHDVDKLDFITISGNNALGHQFKSQTLGLEDGKPDDIIYRTVELEGACSSCWLNFVMIYATFTNGEKRTVLKAHI